MGAIVARAIVFVPFFVEFGRGMRARTNLGIWARILGMFQRFGCLG